MMPGQPNQTRRIFLGAAAIGVAATLAKIFPSQAANAEERLMSVIHPERSSFLRSLTSGARSLVTDEGTMPDLNGATGWLNTAPLTAKSLRGKVVLADIWTYSCINSLRQLPYLKSWAAKYRDAGLVVIGVHSPEFEFEKDRANIEQAVRELQVTYPVAIDSNQRIWQAFNNEYWPADYFVDAKGTIRHHHFGEGDYEGSERLIQDLLKQNGATGLGAIVGAGAASGIEVPPSNTVKTPETYVGYRRADSFASPELMAHDARQKYSAPSGPTLNQWGLGGVWTVGGESAVPQDAHCRIVFRFHARDAHLVLGPTSKGDRVRFMVKLDGAAPGDDHGTDVAPDGSGEIREPRLYQLVRQKGQVDDRTLEIEFLDPGAHAYVFTFG
jgi:thiol-disulfide isomerase/thioredoxin